MCRSQDNLFIFYEVKASACCFVSRKAWLRDKNPSGNPKARRVRIALKCGIRENGAQNPKFFPLSLPSGNRGYGTEKSGSLSETSDSRSVSTCKRISYPKRRRLQTRKSSSGQRMKGDQKRRHTEGESTLFQWWTSANPEVRVQRGECSQGQSQAWTWVWVHPGGILERAVSSEETILCMKNLYKEDDFQVSHERHVRIRGDFRKRAEPNMPLCKPLWLWGN